MPSLVLGKVTKFQDPSSSHFGDILEKYVGWMKTTPATNRARSGQIHNGHDTKMGMIKRVTRRLWTISNLYFNNEPYIIL